MAEKLTKKELLTQIDEKIQDLNLLKSALQADKSRKPEMLDDYKKRFHDLLDPKKK